MLVELLFTLLKNLVGKFKRFEICFELALKKNRLLLAANKIISYAKEESRI